MGAEPFILNVSSVLILQNKALNAISLWTSSNPQHKELHGHFISLIAIALANSEKSLR
jgi:hypothetical protein